MKLLRDYAAAVESHTGWPVVGTMAPWVGRSERHGPELVRHLPGVGWLVGAAGCVGLAVVGVMMPAGPMGALVAATAGLAVTIGLARGRNEQAFADFVAGPVDLLGNSPTARAGTWQALALVLGVAARIALVAVLASRSPVAVLAALFAGHVMSRFWPVLLAQPAQPAPPQEDIDAILRSRPTPAQHTLGIAMAWCAIPVALATWHSLGLAFAGVVASGLAFLGMRRLMASRPTMAPEAAMAATQVACEIAFLFGAAAGLNFSA